MSAKKHIQRVGLKIGEQLTADDITVQFNAQNQVLVTIAELESITLTPRVALDLAQRLLRVALFAID